MPKSEKQTIGRIQKIEDAIEKVFLEIAKFIRDIRIYLKNKKIYELINRMWRIFDILALSYIFIRVLGR